MVPGRQQLSETVLNGLVGKVVDGIRGVVSGRFGTGQSDSWKNIGRKSIVMSLINVEYMPYVLNAFDISAMAKTAENLLDLVLKEITYCQEKLGVVVVAWCTDNGGDVKKMRRLL
ncbi:hypothetical protein JAAARDRAFT_137846 [Jaapia argillacea MUCL 33604]|uniref:DUF659 domain-containing protein n=1 Tax=Jaapia argillacea MUCL 33604 TaxID=933084 RepID=A0A067PDP2_9AGAM|nr:hypothetical protein JAAARDRAFT_137846 [Jaapia argillacea MUCL 33604]